MWPNPTPAEIDLLKDPRVKALADELRQRSSGIDVGWYSRVIPSAAGNPPARARVRIVYLELALVSLVVIIWESEACKPERVHGLAQKQSAIDGSNPKRS